MDALLVGAVLFASVVPGSVPERTLVRFTGAGGAVIGRMVSQTSEVYLVETGTGERLTLPQPGRTLRGRLVSVDDGTMTVLLDHEPAIVRVPLASVHDLRISRGRVSAWSRGLVIGMGVGAVFGLTLGSGLCSGDFACSAGGAAAYGLLGAVAGGATGAFLKHENWQAVEPGALKVAVRPVRGGAGMSLTFGLRRR